MKYLIVALVFVFGGMAAWWLGKRLSTDAVAMAVGLLFGALALLPTWLLIGYSAANRAADDHVRWRIEVESRRRQLEAEQWRASLRMLTVESEEQDGPVVVHKSFSVADPFAHLVDQQLQ